MSTSSNTASSGGGFGTLLLAAFVFCKLAGVTAIAQWSWWWVLSPMWISALLVLVIAILFAGYRWAHD